MWGVLWDLWIIISSCSYGCSEHYTVSHPVCLLTHLKEERALNTTHTVYCPVMLDVNCAHVFMAVTEEAEAELKTGNNPSAHQKQIKCHPAHSHLRCTHPVFVIHDVAQHVIHVQNASIAMLQPVDLDPVVGVLKKEEELAELIGDLKKSYSYVTEAM